MVFMKIGGILKKWFLEKKLCICFTKWASYSVFEEDVKGTIEVGKLADLTIFNKDIMTIPEEDIMSSEVIMTIVGGKVVYSK